MGKHDDDLTLDMQDPVLLKDIQLSAEKVKFLEARANPDGPSYCFMCRWIFEDYQKNGTLTGVKQDGALGAYEIFPIRGEMHHLWLELYGKGYPFKRKVIPDETRIHGRKEPPKVDAPATPQVPLSKPAGKQEPPPEPPPPEAPLSQVPLSKPKR